MPSSFHFRFSVKVTKNRKISCLPENDSWFLRFWSKLTKKQNTNIGMNPTISTSIEYFVKMSCLKIAFSYSNEWQ
jgi:hypothetical protein